MGVLLKPTPHMGAWAVEMFTDRTCLRRTALADSAPTTRARRSHLAVPDDVKLPQLDVEEAEAERGFGFEIADLEPVIATLDQVLGDALYFDYIGRVNIDLGRWRRPRAEDGWVTIDGPIAEASTRVHDRAVELRYVHVAELRLVLVDFADIRAADDDS
ncbi:hypothetical protein SAMN04489727_1990 [Amycolatopsis tolypomycina]|uniref:Uncharacterized protein n=1 Tax=Amycolatopsis tolypomycina TaxID=208445 RepID=A0A1H4JKG9_9PSEU|nr:hypothetical protein [Amycolatopsis tolypomycina]SEB46820.1 hypothetical protein SAMN04489727_1990 [Amycolatopsis tolypomycina]